MQSPDPGAERAIVSVPVLRAAAALVLLASLVSGTRALVRAYDRAFHEAGLSVFPPSVVRQIEQVRAEVPPGEGILLVSASNTDGSWYTRLFQRALYPRNAVVVRYLPLSGSDASALRRTRPLRYGVSLSPAPAALDFATVRDLGALPAMPDHVWIGALAR